MSVVVKLLAMPTVEDYFLDMNNSMAASALVFAGVWLHLGLRKGEICVGAIVRLFVSI